jgi:hypothetical protein
LNSILEKFEIDGEDFRRLGVQDHEWRPSVIRQAASRSARGLARRLLKQKSPQAIHQLSRVSLTTYRLLDPRRRVDAAARAHIGRILPQTLSAADTSSFLAALNSGAPVDLPFGPDSEPQVTSVESIEMVGEDTEMLAAAMKWSDKLQHDDILRSGPRWRQWQKLSRRWLVPSIFAGSMLIGGFMGLRSLDSFPSLRIETSPAGSGSVQTSSVLATSVPAKGKPEDLAKPIETPTIETSQAARTEVSPDSVNGNALPSSVTSTSEVEAAEASNADLTASTMKSDPVSKPDIESESTSIFGENLEVDPEVPVRHPVPTPSQYDQAKMVYQDRYGDDSRIETLAEARLRIEAAWAAQLDSDVTIRYLASHQSVRWSWWIEPTPTIHDRIENFCKQYEIEYGDILAQSYLAALDRTRLPEIGEIVLAHLPAVVDRLSTERRFEEVTAVLDRALQTADLLQAPDCRSFVESFQVINSRNLRMKQSCGKYLISGETPPTQMEGADASMLGRYLGLVLRQWDQALPLLTEVSDARIAGIARSEINALKKDPDLANEVSLVDVESIVEIAKRWRAAAEKSTNDHESESMRLHSLDLLQSVQEIASPLQKIEIEALNASITDQMRIPLANRLGTVSR